MLHASTLPGRLRADHRTVSHAAVCGGICFLAVVAISGLPQVASGEVIADWRFQQGTDGDVAEPSQLIVDSSGNDRHGRAAGRPKYRSVPLRASNLGLVFDGVDDRVYVPDHELFYLIRSMTIEAYIKIDNYAASTGQLGHLVFRGDDRLGFDPWYLAITESGQVRFLVADALSQASVIDSPGPLPLSEFVHIAATLDDESGKQTLYVNGMKVASTKTKIRGCGQLGGSNPGIGIGNRFIHSNQAFRGTIARVRISDEALRPAQFLPLALTKAESAARDRLAQDR